MPNSNLDPHSIDFSALNTLRLVHELGSFTAAAEKLDVNQSAVSYTINKLRRSFHDPLFVRERGKQVCTDRCDHIVAKSLEMLATLAELSHAEAFVPETSDQTVSIACNYYERMLVVPKIVTALRQQAPGMKIKVVDARGEGHLRLLQREADVLIGPFMRAESGFYSRRLLADDYVCLMDPAHPMAGRKIDLDHYLELEHILINYGGGWKSVYLQELERRGHEINAALVVPSPAGLHEVVSGSTLLATLPRRLVGAIGDGLATCDCPVRGAFNISLVWTARTHASALHLWLRSVITKSCAAEGESGRL